MDNFAFQLANPPRPVKALRVCFLRNNDPHFQGVCIAVSRFRFKDFQALLEGVTEALRKHVPLRSAITHIWRIDGSPFTTMMCFCEGDIVVCCCKYEIFSRICYQVNKDFLRLYGSLLRWQGVRSERNNCLQAIKTDELPESVHLYIANIKPIFQSMRAAIFRGQSNGDEAMPFIIKMVDKVVWSEMCPMVGKHCWFPSFQLMKANSEDPYQEVEMMRALQSHENILELVYTIEQKQFIYLVIEYMDHDLDYLIRTRGLIAQKDAKAVISATTAGLVHMHRHQIIHRDIKPENIFISINREFPERDPWCWPVIGNIKIADFGMAISYRGSKLYACCGTPPYMAPELIKEAGYDYLVDSWSLGISIYQMFFGRRPFGETSDNMNDLYDTIVNAELRYPIDWMRCTTREGRDLLDALLVKNPARRMSINDVKKHPYLCSP